MAKKSEWSERVEFSLDRKPRPSEPMKHKGFEIFTLNKYGGYEHKAIGKDFQLGKTYILEKRKFWWILL